MVVGSRCCCLVLWWTDYFFFHSVQARHDDFSDFPAIIPFKAKRVVVLGGVIQKLCLAFLGDGLAEELAKEPRRDKEVTEGKKGKKRLVGEFGEVLVHA